MLKGAPCWSLPRASWTLCMSWRHIPVSYSILLLLTLALCLCLQVKLSLRRSYYNFVWILVCPMRATYCTHFTISSLLVEYRSHEARNSLLFQTQSGCSVMDLSMNHFIALQILTLQFLSVRGLRFLERCWWRSKYYGLWRRADWSVVTGVSECLPDARYGCIAFIRNVVDCLSVDTE